MRRAINIRDTSAICVADPKPFLYVIKAVVLTAELALSSIWIGHTLMTTHTVETKALEIVAPAVSYEAVDAAAWSTDTASWKGGWK